MLARSAVSLAGSASAVPEQRWHSAVHSCSLWELTDDPLQRQHRHAFDAERWTDSIDAPTRTRHRGRCTRPAATYMIGIHQFHCRESA